ncbi:MAG TPA: hypothetical protein VI072_12550 [Polyangiaceae bacterium]
MREVTARIEDRTRQLHDHAFFRWLNDANCPLDQRFAFSPVLVEFIMGFSDMNKWFLSYREPETRFHEEINEHTLEDRTHSRWFVDDWIKLDFNGRLGWSASETLWWWFLCGETELIRRLAMETLELTVQHEDPLERFAMMQAIEACGDVFFGNTVNVARELGAKTGLEYRYFGDFHRARETGHLHADEDLFTTSILRSEQRERALRLVDRMFDMFVEELDCLHDYARRATEHPAELREALAAEREAMLGHPAVDTARESTPDAGLDVTQAKLLEVFEVRKGRLMAHPFVAWLRDESGPPPAEKLQRFVPLWAIDILGYADFNRYILRYRDPKDEAERAINQWTEQLASRSALYFRDWRALGLDERLRWQPDQVISFYFLGEESELHRRNMAKVKIFAISRPAPSARFWLMRALEAGRDALLEAAAPLVTETEQQRGVRLDYWARRDFSPSSTGGELDALRLFSAVPLAPGSEDALLQAVNTIFDNFEEQFSLSLRVARSNFIRASEANAEYVSEARLRSGAESGVGRSATGSGK